MKDSKQPKENDRKGSPSRESTQALTDLCRHEYVSLETSRANGTRVATPVWVARLANKLVIVTERDSWKVKRIRGNATVRLAACDMRGGSLGTFIAGNARIIERPDAMQGGMSAIQAKYGWKNLPFRLLSFLNRKPRVILEVTDQEPRGDRES